MFLRAPLRRVLLLAIAIDARAAGADTGFFVDLVYEPDALLAGCPSEADFRTMISDQLGRNPFRAGAEQKVVARAHAAVQGLRGFVEWHDASGTPRGERELGSESTDCVALARAMSFAIAVQIQLLAEEAQTAEVLPSKEVASDEPSRTASAPLVSTPNRKPDGGRSTSDGRSEEPPESHFMLGAGPTVAFGLAPRMAVEGRILAGVRSGRIALELGGEASLPSRYTTSNGDGFEQQVVLGSAAGCAFFQRLSGCLVGKVGKLSVRGFGVDVPNSASGTLVQVGPRLTLNQAFGGRWFGALRVDVLASLISWEVTLNQSEIWRTPLLCLSVGGDVGLLF